MVRESRCRPRAIVDDERSHCRPRYRVEGSTSKHSQRTALRLGFDDGVLEQVAEDPGPSANRSGAASAAQLEREPADASPTIDWAWYSDTLFDRRAGCRAGAMTQDVSPGCAMTQPGRRTHSGGRPPRRWTSGCGLAPDPHRTPQVSAPLRRVDRRNHVHASPSATKLGLAPRGDNGYSIDNRYLMEARLR
jgi:hypothetical protein